MREFTFSIAFIKSVGVGLKQHPWRYCISSVFVFSLVIIAWSWCQNGVDMGMSHNPSALFPCPLKISSEPLIILISFLSNMEMQSSSHSCTKEIRKALCSPSKMYAFFYGF